MMRPAVPLLSFALVCGLLLPGCPPVPGLPGPSGDAAAWDVYLPDAAIPDGYLITQLAADGGTESVTPETACDVADASEAGAVDALVAAAPGARDAADAIDAQDAQDATDASLAAIGCPSPLAAGDLLFDEVMISTQPGSADRGQWLEVRSTRSCAIDLVGLHVSAPHGQAFRTVDVATDTWIPPGGFFLIADTLDPTQNNDLPGTVLAWAGSPADAIHKTADAITLSVGEVTLDVLTYPDKTRPEGISYSFPWGCTPALRADFANWRPSTHLWTAGLYGTPGAPNTDVRCNVTAAPGCPHAKRPTARP